MELINFVTGLGYPIVAAGKGKNDPLHIDATPDAYAEEAKRRNMNPRMLSHLLMVQKPWWRWQPFQMQQD